MITEKERRIYYQDIVYKVCSSLDHAFDDTTVCGTVEDPCSEVQERVRELVVKSRIEKEIDGSGFVDADELEQDLKDLVDYWRNENVAEGRRGDDQNLSPIRNALRVMRQSEATIERFKTNSKQPISRTVEHAEEHATIMANFLQYQTVHSMNLPKVGKGSELYKLSRQYHTIRDRSQIDSFTENDCVLLAHAVIFVNATDSPVQIADLHEDVVKCLMRWFDPEHESYENIQSYCSTPEDLAGQQRYKDLKYLCTWFRENMYDKGVPRWHDDSEIGKVVHRNKNLVPDGKNYWDEDLKYIVACCLKTQNMTGIIEWSPKLKDLLDKHAT